MNKPNQSINEDLTSGSTSEGFVRDVPSGMGITD